MTTDDKPAPEPTATEINAAMASEWRRRSDGSLWRIREYLFRFPGCGRDGINLKRIRFASEPQPAGGFRDEPVHVPDLAALRADFTASRVPRGCAEVYDVPGEQSFECEATMTITPEGERFFREHEPAPHPAPWRWDGAAVGIVATTRLNDANGEALVRVVPGLVTGLAHLEIAPRARALIAAAPEMVALLRDWKGYPHPVHGDCDCLYCRTVRVLASIDAAGKAKP